MHTRHQMDILHHSTDGYVGTCCSCGRFQVAFGTSMFQIHEDMLRGLLHELAEDERYCAERVDPRTKCFVYDVGSECVRMVLNHTEVVRLRSMLSDALWMQGIMEEVGSEPK
ncbi:MAG: hypothetical protein KF797_11800 [Flavobacteriales bacterium]|nr:hypothetical protein [Flavobacteriales bacterium]